MGKRLLKGLMLVLVLFSFTSCQVVDFVQGLIDPEPKPSPVNQTLAQQVVGEYLTALKSTDFGKSAQMRGLSTTSISVLESNILDAIAAEGLNQSNDVEKISQALLKGASTGTSSLQITELAGDDDTASSILVTAVDSTTASVAKRPTKINTSGGSTAASVVGKLAKNGVSGFLKSFKNNKATLKKSIGGMLNKIKSKASLFRAAATDTELEFMSAAVGGVVVASLEEGGDVGNEMVQSAFAQAAEDLPPEALSGVVSSALEAAQEADASFDSTQAGELLVQASAGLENVEGVSLTSILEEAAAEVQSSLGTIDTTAAVQVAQEVRPTAALALGAGVNSPLEFNEAGSQTIQLSAAGTTSVGTEVTLFSASGLDPEQTITNVDSPVDVKVYPGVNIFILSVENVGGIKSDFAKVTVVMKFRPAETQPVAMLQVKNGTQEVTTPLPFKKEGYDLTITSTGSTATGVTYQLLTDEGGLYSSTNGTFSVHQESASVVAYTLIVRNTGGKMFDKKTKVVTIGAPTAVRVSAVTLDKTVLGTIEAPFPVGQFYPLKATITPADATNQQLIWTTSAPKVATVNQEGMVRALSAGTTKVRATSVDGSKFAEVTVNVTVKVTFVPVTGIEITSATDPIEMRKDDDDPVTLTANVLPANATIKLFSWSSSDESVAFVDVWGNVYATGVGKAIITAKTNDGAKIDTVEVIVKLAPVTGDNTGTSFFIEPPEPYIVTITLVPQEDGGYIATAGFDGVADGYKWYYDGVFQEYAFGPEVILPWMPDTDLTKHDLAVSITDHSGVDYAGNVKVVFNQAQ